jgi:hypothetical protein
MLAGAPASAAARLIGYGSLGTQASIAETHGADTAFWIGATPAGAGTAPASGQLRLVRLRGCALRGTNGQLPLTQFHIQVLRPRDRGGVTVAGTSQALNLPVCGAGAGTAMVSTYHPTHLCVAAGDWVAFNDEGGFATGFPAGVPYEVFAPAVGFATEFFNRGGATNNGDSFTGAPLGGVELLMRSVIGTGRNAGPLCR